MEQAPAGTAGSVKLAEGFLRDDTFIVISGDALTDFDLGEIVAFHKQRGAMVTIALKRVENPLEFGVVVVDDEGRIERFLEKPTWGQVFSDTVNTGIYVLEPEVFDHIPADTKYDFSQDLFPRLFEMGAPLYGYVADGYWQDIGSLPQYLTANCDLLDGKVAAGIPGIELQHRIFVGDGINLDSIENISGPAYIGNYAKIAEHGQHRQVHGARQQRGGQGSRRDAQLRDRLTTPTSAPRPRCWGTILGKNCDVKAGATFSEGVAVGDECVIGEQAYIAPDVKIYPFKTVESGAADQLQHHLGVARHLAAVRQGRHRSASSTSTSPPSWRCASPWPTARCSRRARASPRAATLIRRRGSSSAPSSAASARPASWSATCAWRAAPSTASRSRTAAPRAACTCASPAGTRR